MTKLSSSSKYLLFAIIGLVLVAIMLGGYKLLSGSSLPQTQQPTTSNQTSNWKTYTNYKYGFSFKYPSDWMYLEVPNETYQIEQDEVWLYKESARLPKPQTNATTDIVFRITTNDPSPDWNPQYFDDYDSSTSQTGSISYTKISGINKVGGFREDVAILKTENFYILALTNGESNSLEYLSQILSTFTFLVDNTNASTDECVKGGCSGTGCLEKSKADQLSTTCEWKEEYACYRTATCERQLNGRCGWTQTNELLSCLEEK